MPKQIEFGAGTRYKEIVEGWYTVKSSAKPSRVGPRGLSNNGAFAEEWGFSQRQYRQYLLVTEILTKLPPSTGVLLEFEHNGHNPLNFHPCDPITRATQDGSKVLEQIRDLVPMSEIVALALRRFKEILLSELKKNPDFDAKKKEFETA